MGRKAGSGFLLGVICLIKPHYGLFLVWAALRREWRFFVVCGVTIFVGLVASVAVYWWANHVDYAKLLAPTGLRIRNERRFPVLFGSNPAYAAILAERTR